MSNKTDDQVRAYVGLGFWCGAAVVCGATIMDLPGNINTVSVGLLLIAAVQLYRYTSEDKLAQETLAFALKATAAFVVLNVLSSLAYKAAGGT